MLLPDLPAKPHSAAQAPAAAFPSRCHSTRHKTDPFLSASSPRHLALPADAAPCHARRAGGFPVMWRCFGDIQLCSYPMAPGPKA